MSTQPNPEPDRPQDLDRKALLPKDRHSTTPEDELQVFGLVRGAPKPDHDIHHALSLRPDEYFKPKPAEGE